MKLILTLTLLVTCMWFVSKFPETFRLAHTTNRNHRLPDLPKTYLMLSQDLEKCRLTKRHETTLRRADARLRPLKQSCLRFGKKSWVLIQKNRGMKILLSQADQNIDNYYSLYQKEIEQGELKHWPKISQTILYIRRLYQGLYLEIDLSSLNQKKEPFEYLLLRKDRVIAVDHKLRSETKMFQNLLNLGQALPFKPLTKAERFIWKKLKNVEQLAVLTAKQIQTYPLPFEISQILLAKNAKLPAAILSGQIQTWWNNYDR